MSSPRKSGQAGAGHQDASEERWLLPYADMITLLLGLFIVLFAMSSIDAKQFDQVRRSLAKTFDGSAALDQSDGVLPGASGILDPTSPSQGQTDALVSTDVASRTQAVSQSEAQFDRQFKELDQLQERLGLGKDVTVSRSEVGIQISIAGDALFAPGSYELASPGIKRELVRIERELEGFRHNIRIEGHTDGQPMDGEFGNDGLAAMRALAVQRFFAKNGYSNSLMYAVSMGAKKPKVKPAYKTASVAANRRIEIVVLEPGAEGGFTNSGSTKGAAAPITRSASGHTPNEIASAQVNSAVLSEFDSAVINQIAGAGRSAP